MKHVDGQGPLFLDEKHMMQMAGIAKGFGDTVFVHQVNALNVLQKLVPAVVPSNLLPACSQIGLVFVVC